LQIRRRDSAIPFSREEKEKSFLFLLFESASVHKAREEVCVGMLVSGMELQCSASVDQMMSTVIENNLFSPSFTSTQAKYCEIGEISPQISPQPFESSDTPQEEPLAEEVKPESTVQWERKLVRMVSGLFLRSRGLDFREVQCLILIAELHDRERAR
jgi:hypothetical protein